jgi:kinetochore protein Spc24, fungi type
VQYCKTAPDLASINRIHSSHSALSSFRSAITHDHAQRLAQLNRRLQTLSSQHSLTLAQHNPTAHAADILRLDTDKFRVAKQASDLEIEGERLAAELEGVRATWEECEREGVEGGENGRTLPEEDEVL